MVLFLASELMFFGGMFAAYFTLRSLTPAWPPADVHLEMPLTLLATVLLTASSLTMHRAVGDRDQAMRHWLIVTLGLGVAFLAIKAYELATAGFTVSSHAYGSLFFTMLGAHAVHLTVGIALIAYLLARRTGPGVPDAVAYYWHFIDVVWLAIFATIYLVR